MNWKRTLSVTCLIVGYLTGAVWAQSSGPAIFISNNVGDSVSSFLVQPDGSLSFVNVFASGDGPQAIALSPNGRFLAVGHGTSSQTTEELRIFEVNSDATLTPRLTTLVPDSPLDAIWMSDSILAVPETDFSLSTVRTYHFDDMANTLLPVDVEATGGFASSVARSGDFLFVNDTSGNKISSVAVDANGAMNLVQAHPTGGIFTVDLEVSPDGNFIYGPGGISGNGESILAYSIDASGMLTLVPGSPFISPGSSPKVTAMTDDGQILVAGHGTDATFWTFLRDPQTGALASTPFSFDVGLQGTLGDLAIMGDLLFVTDESTALDGITGVYSFRLHADGSFTQLGTILPTQGARPEYIATWAGMATTLCDFDLDGDCDIDDLNDMLAEGPIAPGVPVSGANAQFDLDGNGQIDLNDMSEWLAAAATDNGLGSPYKVGDANLDGVVDGGDFLLWNGGKFTSSLQWDQGDFNGDGAVDGADFLAWNASKFTSSDVATVPEPRMAWLAWTVVVSVGLRRWRRDACHAAG